MTAYFQNASEFIKGLANPTDLIIIVVILYGAFIGYHRGLIRTVIGSVRFLVSMFGATIVARIISPIIAPMIVEPIVKKVFETKLSGASDLAPQIITQLQNNMTQIATAFAQSIAFSIVFFVFMFVISFVLNIFVKAMNMLTRIPPISFLNRIGGLALGVLISVLVCIIALSVLKYFAPEIFGDMGYLSPENIAKTKLTSYLLNLFAKA